MKKTFLIAAVLIFFLITITIFSICMGSVAIKPYDIIHPNGTTAYIIYNMRIPRTLGAILAGSLLAVSGMIFQCVFKNPMADSYILGISSGASCSVAIAFAFGVSINNSQILPLFALTGSILTTLFLLTSNRKDHYGLLLTGIATNFLLSALTTLFVYLGKRQLDAIMYWTMGSLANSNWLKITVMAIALVILTVFSLFKSETMDILLLDDSTAISSGVNLKKERTSLLIISSATTAIVVSYCGVIGFIGLMSPHISRLIAGPKHRKLFPFTILFGAILLLTADLISRTAVAPSELPVGIITSIIGAPLFFIILKRKKSWIK